MATVELLRAIKPSLSAAPILDALVRAVGAAGDQVRETGGYEGKSEWLVLQGVGNRQHDAARRAHVRQGGRVLIWDFGYWDREKITGHMRMSIDHDHPQGWLDRTPLDVGRSVPVLREDTDPTGPIVLVGLGRKSRKYLKAGEWERWMHADLVRRFPGRRIIFKPKPGDLTSVSCETVHADTPIEELLKGASLLVCRHSNCAVDAAIAGVEFEATDGAAMWLRRRDFTPANRLEFLQRLAWWQYKPHEASLAWSFAKQVVQA